MSRLVEQLQVPGHARVWRVPCASSVAFVALHAVLAGRAFGGIRIRGYPDERAALRDALELSRAMSRKLALAGIVGGGGKSVLIEPDACDRAAAVAALGAFIEGLQGRYCCGPDLGFSDADDAVLREATSHVAVPGMSASTAVSVEAAIRAAAPAVSRVAIQGMGSVGAPLARSLQSVGVHVVVADLQPVAAYENVAAERVHAQPCDVFAPCAAGGTLDDHTIDELRCAVVCGGANNPLAEARGAKRLRARGIVLVPDIIASSGAAIVGASASLGESQLVERRLQAVGPLTQLVLARAESEGRPPIAIAEAMADERIAALRGV